MYRIYLFDDPLVWRDIGVARSLRPGTEMLGGAPPDAATEERKFRLADAVSRRNTRLCADWRPLGKGAYARKLSAQWSYSSTDATMHRVWILEECLERHRATGNRIVVSIYDRSAAVTLPFWWDVEMRRSARAEAWMYLEALEQAGGFRTFDPQLGRWLDLTVDREAVLAGYHAAAKQVEQ